jgi:ribosomal subunit interface protein
VTMEGHGHVVRARASGPDMLTAVDRVVDKLELRLVRLKGRLVGRSHPRRQAPVD